MKSFPNHFPLFLSVACVPLAGAASVPALGQEQVPAADGDLLFEPDYFRASAPATALDMVLRVPGFAIDSGDAVRGYAGAAGNVLIDGARPSTKNDTIETLLRAIPAGQVARLELIRGDRPGLDRQGVQLVLNVVRKATGDAVRTYTLSGYAYPDGTVRPSFRFETSRRKPGGGWEASVLLSTNQDESGTGQRMRRGAQGEEIEHARIAVDSPIKGAEARLAGDLPFAGGTVRGNMSLGHQDYRTHERLDFLTGPFAEETARIDDKIRTDNAEAGMEWTRLFGKSLTAKLLLLGTRKDVAIRSASNEGGLASEYEGDSLADERIVRLALDRPSDNGPGWEAGAEIAYNSLGSKARLSLDDIPFALPNADIKVSERRGDAFARLKWTLSRSVQAEATIRVEHSSLRQLDRSSGTDLDRDFGFVKPKLALQWDMSPRSQLRLRAEREVGQLDFSDFASTASLIDGTIDAGNVDLRPQTAWIYEAAWERRFARDGALTVTLRREQIDNVLDRLPVGTLDAPGNIGPGTVDTVALGLSLPLDAIGLAGGRLAFDGEWNRSEVRDPVTGLARAITAKAPFAGDLHATLDRPALKSSFTLDVYFGQELTYSRIDEVRRTFDEPYVSLKWTYRPSKRLTVEASAENILSRKRQRDRDLYDGPRDAASLLFSEHRTYRSRSGLFLSLRFQ